MKKEQEEKSMAKYAEAQAADETNATYHIHHRHDRHNKELKSDQRCSSTDVARKDNSPSDADRPRDRSKSPLSPTTRPSHVSRRGRSSSSSQRRNASSITARQSTRSSRYGSRRGCPSASASRSRSRSNDGSRTRSPSVSVSRSRSRSPNNGSSPSRRSRPRRDPSEQSNHEAKSHTALVVQKSASPLRRAKTDGSHSKKRHNSSSPLRRAKTDGCYHQETTDDSSKRHHRPARSTSGSNNKQQQNKRSKSPKRSVNPAKSGSERGNTNETKLERTSPDGKKGRHRKSSSPHRSLQRAKTDEKKLQDAATAIASKKHPTKQGSTSLRRTVSEGYQSSSSTRHLRGREGHIAEAKLKRCESANEKVVESLSPGKAEGSAGSLEKVDAFPGSSKPEGATTEGSAIKSRGGRRHKSPSSQSSSQQTKTREKRVRGDTDAPLAGLKPGLTSLQRAVSEGHRPSSPTMQIRVSEGHASPSQRFNKDPTSHPGQRREHKPNRPSNGCDAKTNDDHNEEEDHKSPGYKCRSRRHKNAHANSVMHAQVEHGVAHQDKLLEAERLTQQEEKQQKQYQQWQEEIDNSMAEEKQEEDEPDRSGAGGIIGQSVSTLLHMPLAAATMAPKLVTGTAVVAAKTTVAATATAGAAASTTAQAVGSGALATANTAAHVFTGAANVALNFVPFSVTEQSYYYEHNNEIASVKSQQARTHNAAAVGGRPLVVGPQID